MLLARAGYAVYDSLGLQRARVRSIALRADALRPADRATRQLSLDPEDDKPLAIEAVPDLAFAPLRTPGGLPRHPRHQRPPTAGPASFRELGEDADRHLRMSAQTSYAWFRRWEPGNVCRR